MALRFMDGFDYYATSDISRKWIENGNPIIQNVEVRNGINAIEMKLASDSVVQTIDDQASWVVGLALQVDKIDNTNNFLEFLDAGSTQAILRINADGTLEVRRSTTAVTDGVSVLSLSTNTWYYIEMKITIANSIGANSCKVRVNEIDWITVATGQDLQVTANATASGIKVRCGRSAVDMQFDDIYICDGTGGVNDDFLGDVKVVAILPDGNGTTNQFTGSDADSTDNYLHVDETDTDDDTSYVESSTVGHIDLYTFDNLAGSQTIHAVQVNNVVKKDDAGTRTIRAVTRPVSTNYFGGSKSPSNGSYTNETHTYDVSPETSIAWTASEIDGTEFGMEIET